MQPLLDFIEAMKSQGATDEFVVALMRQNGWPERRIYQAFAAWYEARTGIAVPNGGGRIEAAKDAFFYLLAFITLGIWTTQLGAVFFAAIDRTFPNAAADYGESAVLTQSLAGSLASIIVAFPLFLLVTRAIERGLERQPERLESPVRKWLTYLALVVTASTMIGDLVIFLAYLLRGDLDVRFVLRIVAVLVIAGGVFGYYLDSLRRERTSAVRNWSFAGAALAVVAFGISAGFVQLGSPAVQRSASQDGRRLYDLSVLAQSLHGRWLKRGTKEVVLPATIRDIPVMGYGPSGRLVDPESGRAYLYYPGLPGVGTSYRLCATFASASAADVPQEWRHAAGDACFTLDARDAVAAMRQGF